MSQLSSTRGRYRGRGRGRGRGNRKDLPLTQSTSVDEPVSESSTMEPLIAGLTEEVLKLKVKKTRQPQVPPPPAQPYHTHPPFFNIGDEVIYNQIGHRTNDEIGRASPSAWRKWRTYIVRRNEYLTHEGKWMYQIAEIGGDTLTLAPEELLVDIRYPPHTRVELAKDWVGVLGKGEKMSQGRIEAEAKWIVKSCRLVGGKAGWGSFMVYDLQNENGEGLMDNKFNVKEGELMPYEGPKPDVEGHWRA